MADIGVNPLASNMPPPAPEPNALHQSSIWSTIGTPFTRLISIPAREGGLMIRGLPRPDAALDHVGFVASEEGVDLRDVVGRHKSGDLVFEISSSCTGFVHVFDVGNF